MKTYGYVLIAAAVFSGPAAFGDVDPVSGVDFVTIGAVNNPAYTGPDPENRVTGRGSVGYEYKIGRMEVTTAQWLDFMNAAFDRPANDRLPFVDFPVFWGASGVTPQNAGGRRWSVPQGNENRLAGGITWRTAAMYCNWLTNDKRTDRAAFLNGAYDTSTFGQLSNGIRTDQAAHNPGAKYWIPTLDEWLKAVHFDPAANNGQGRWWQQPNGTDTPLMYGTPPSMGGTGMANSGFRLPGFAEAQIPLGSYPTVTTPWGLLDAAGGTIEILETKFGSRGDRFMDGSYFGSEETVVDRPFVLGSTLPDDLVPWHGLRIATIPTPAGMTLVALGVVVFAARRRRSLPWRIQACASVSSPPSPPCC